MIQAGKNFVIDDGYKNDGYRFHITIRFPPSPYCNRQMVYCGIQFPFRVIDANYSAIELLCKCPRRFYSKSSF